MSVRLIGGKKRERRWGVLRAVLVAGSLGMVALLLAGSIASRVPADRYWTLQLLGIGLPLIRLLVAGLAVGAILASSYRLGVLLVLTLVLSLGLTWSVDDRTNMTTVPTEAPGLTLMTFNATPRRAAQRQHALGTFLEHEAPHVIAMQELQVRMTSDSTIGPPLIAPLLHQGAYAIAWSWANIQDWIDLPIFSRLVPVDTSQYVLGGGRDGRKERQQDTWRSGGVVRQVYEWQGEQIALYNVHLHSFGALRPWQEGWRHALSLSAWRSALALYRQDFATRAQQARELRTLLEGEALPFIVCGDFNSTPNDWAYAHLSEGLLDAFKVAGKGWGATYPASRPLVRIDFVLASPEWRVRRSYVVKALSSDHRPVIAELVLDRSVAPSIPGG